MDATMARHRRAITRRRSHGRVMSGTSRFEGPSKAIRAPLKGAPAAQGASAARFFSISRRPAIRPRRAASPFRHAIWRACRLICRSERFSGSRGCVCPITSQARTGSRRRDPAVGIAGQRLAHEFIPGERTSEPVARHDLKTPDQVHIYGRALRTVKLPSRRLHDPCCR